jgi:hypothetical protein
MTFERREYLARKKYGQTRNDPTELLRWHVSNDELISNIASIVPAQA